MTDEKQIQNALEMKEHITQKIEEYQKKIEWLQKNLELLDGIVKQSSFTKASHMVKENPKGQKHVVPILRSGTREIIANASINDEQIVIEIVEENLNQDIPPFKTFFIERIIKEMQERDTRDGIKPIMKCNANNGEKLKEITIENYRKEERVKDIINAVTWVLSKMLENSEKDG